MEPTRLKALMLLCLSLAILCIVYIGIVYGDNTLHSLRIKWMAINILKLEDVPNMTVTEIDCHLLFKGNRRDMQKAEKLQRNWSHPVPTNQQIAELAQDCESYRKTRGYILQPVSMEEHNFPLAYGIVAYRDIDLLERLLRAIYRPQNYYCIHIDKKSNDTYKNAVNSVANCFENVFVSRVSIDVVWPKFSILEANMICMREIRKYKAWKYFINLTGQEFALKTNLEIVKIAKSFNGASDIRTSVERRWAVRWAKKFMKDPPPHGIRMGKGQVHVILSRAFVDYATHDKVALRFYYWLNGTGNPDESYFNSLAISYLLDVPGVYTGWLNDSYPVYHSVARMKKWAGPPSFCAGGRVRNSVCIMTIHYLPAMAKAKEIFVNKFQRDYQPLAYSCMEQLIAERVRQEVITGDSSIDLEYYRNVPVVPHRP